MQTTTNKMTRKDAQERVWEIWRRDCLARVPSKMEEDTHTHTDTHTKGKGHKKKIWSNSEGVMEAGVGGGGGGDSKVFVFSPLLASGWQENSKTTNKNRSHAHAVPKTKNYYTYIGIGPSPPAAPTTFFHLTPFGLVNKICIVFCIEKFRPGTTIRGLKLFTPVDPIHP